MSRTYPARSWLLPSVIGVVAVGVFVVLLVTSSALRHYWPLLVLSAGAAALPFLLRDSAAPNGRPLPVRAPGAVDGVTSTAPALRASGITLPKASAAGGENEDAYGIDTDAGYLAIADGASSSFRAAEWATSLCESFLDQQPLGSMTSQSWIADAAATFGDTEQQGSDWWSTEAAERGAHAAFVGLAFLRTEDSLSWRATAVGDCVLVHLRRAPEEQPPIVTAFPVTNSASFPQNPALLSSAVHSQPPVSYIEGSAVIGDVCLLMTDELARWAMRKQEAGDPVWNVLAAATDEDFASIVGEARASAGVADDDMTVVRCEVVAAT